MVVRGSLQKNHAALSLSVRRLVILRRLVVDDAAKPPPTKAVCVYPRATQLLFDICFLVFAGDLPGDQHHLPDFGATVAAFHEQIVA